MNLLIGIVYLAICVVVMHHSSQGWESGLRRAKFWLLGAGMMQLGAWHFLLAMERTLAVEYDWMRQGGHLFLIVFAVLYLAPVWRRYPTN